MKTAARFLQVLALGTWVGSILYFGAVMAPAAFSLLAADEAGALVGVTLKRLHVLGIAAGLIFLLAAMVRERSARALARPAALLVLLMIALTLVSQLWVIAPMDALRFQMGSVAAAALNSAPRVAFDKLHATSVRLEMGVLVSGLLALLLAVRD